MKSEMLKRDRLDKYKVQKMNHHIYVAAAKMWARGVPMPDALAIVEEAFTAATFEEQRPEE